MADITTALIAHWRLNEGAGTAAADEMDDHPGTLVGGAAWGTGIEGAGLVLDGVDDYLDVSGASFNFPDGTATFSMWVKLNAATPSSYFKTGFARLDNTTSTYPSSHYPWTTGSADIATFRQNRVDGIPLSPVVDRAAWHMVTITTEPGANGWRLYQNDQLIHQTTGEAAVALNAATAWIGRGYWPGGDSSYYLDGQIYDVRLYNRALTAEDVAALYANAGAAGGLGVTVPLAAAAVVLANAGGAVALTLPLAGAGQASASAAATLALSIAIEAQAESGAFGDATFGNTPFSGESEFTPPVELTGAASASVTATGDLALAIPLAGAAIAAAAAQGGLNLATQLAGAAHAQAAASGGLALTVSLSGAALAQAVAAAGLVNTPPGEVALAGAAQGVASATAALAMDIPLAGAASVTVTGAGNITHLVPLAGAAVVAVSGTGELTVTAAGVQLAGAALAAAQAGGVLTLRVNLSAAALAAAAASGALANQPQVIAAMLTRRVAAHAADWTVTATAGPWRVRAAA